ncbi:MAG: TolC family protein [Pirellulaceae bacterium]|nr:TolC family protein [Pirellulaceae bacterium]
MSPSTKFFAIPTCVLLMSFSSGCATNRVGHATNMSLTSSDNPSRESTKLSKDRLVTTVSYVDEAENGQATTPESIIVATNSSFSEIVESQPAMTLSDFESLAFSNNPTIRELAATTQKAAGFRTQVGLRANPIVGYQGVQLADRSTDQHTAFIQQEIITGNKLSLNRNVQNEALRSQLFELETQKLRVATDIRVKFYEALAAQRRVELIENFRSVTDKGLELAELRKQALEGSKVDVLQAKVQKNEIDLALQQAQVTYDAAWRELAALAGTPDLATRTLLGELPNTEVQLDWNGLSATMISASPEYQAAQARISRARANLQRQSVQAIPNITAQLAAGVDNGTDSGLINFQIGAPIPVFNKNQGNIAAARAEYCRAVMDAERIQNAIKARLAVVSREFDSSLAAVSKYSQEILPSAQESLELAEVAYKAGETSFVQVLVSRRTYFDSNLQYVLAQSQLAQAKSKVDGYVLTGALDAVIDQSGDDSLRGLTFSQQ